MSDTLPSSTTPRAYLVPRTSTRRDRDWAAAGVALPERGIWKVTGEAGAGVTSLLVDVAAQRAAAGDTVLVLTHSKEAASRLRAELSDQLADTGFVADEPMVRSVHSLAFALLRQRTDREIRLISGAEQDAVIRELLTGHAEDGRGTWPTELRPALEMVGFARQLRDVLLRATERGLGPGDLERLGAEHGVGIWAAAGDFLREYQQVMALTGALRYSAAELVTAVLEGEITQCWDTVIVDDAQHLAPASGELVARLLRGATLGVVGGDLEQSVFRFRGASPTFFADMGGLEHQTIDLGATRRNPQRAVCIAPDAQTQHAAVVDAVRRAHFEDGTAFRDIAVIVRATPMIEPLRRALLHAGVPVALDPTDVVLAEQRIVVALLLGLRSLEEELTATEWRDLLLGPVGGADPVTLRRLLRGLRRLRPDARAEDTLRELLTTPGELADLVPDMDAVLTDRELAILNRVRGVLQQGREVHAGGGSVEEVLWAIWSATGLSDHLLAAALRGGATGSQADRDLDAAMALFDAAGDFTERRPAAGLGLFIQSIAEQELPTGVRDRRTATPDAVRLLTAHGAAGQQFTRVIVAGVQELTWPSLGETGSIFRQEDLIDLVDDGVDPAVPVSHTAERLVEERRLFHVATSRATESLLVTAVENAEGDELIAPSRFIDEFCTTHGLEPEHVRVAAAPSDELAAAEGARPIRVLARDDVVAELRRALSDPACDEATRTQAARQLARLAEAGVPGAASGEWWGVKEASTSEPFTHLPALSPSRIEGLLACPLRDVIERMNQWDETPEMLTGLIAHAYLEALGRGAHPEDAKAAVMAARAQVDRSPGWKRDRELADFAAMLERIDTWLAASRGTFEQLAVEVGVDVTVDEGLRIAGRADRLEREASGAVHVIDLKTGSTLPTIAATEDNPQLAAYQLALSKGMLVSGQVTTAADPADALEVGGAALVYPNAQKQKLAKREQAPLSPEKAAEFTELIRPLPAAMTGPQLQARTGPHCERCRVRSICPVQPEGRATADA